MDSAQVDMRNNRIRGQTLKALPDDYTQDQYDEEYSRQSTLEAFKELRRERNRRLAEVDWIFSEDYHIGDKERGIWLAYRKALRDLPSTTEDPENPVWPEKPSTPSGTTLDRVNLEKSQITLLQNVVFSLTKRIEALENA